MYGLFIPKETAWKGIEHFVLTKGGLYEGMDWLDPDEIPEDGNWA